MSEANNIVIRIKQATKQGYIECCSGGVADLSFPKSKTRRGRVEDGGRICPTVTTTGGLHRLTVVQHDEEYDVRIRKLTEDECYILQGMTAEDSQKCKDVGITKTHLFETAGNGICTSCIKLLSEHLYKAQYNSSYECSDERFINESNKSTE